MGGLLSRSSVQGDGRGKKDKRKRRHQQLEVSFEPEAYLIHDRNEHEDLNIDFGNTYELWDKKFESQQMMNMNNHPGTPTVFPSNYSVTENNLITQSWASPINANNSFYPSNSFSMTPSYNIPFIPDQFNRAQTPNIFNNQSKIVSSEERPSKKVQFSSSSSNQQSSAFKPLTNAHSWHESIDMSSPVTTKSVPLSNRSTLPRPLTATSKTSSAQILVEKPIYVGVDFQATLAERGNKRHRKNGERNHSDGLNSSSGHRRAHSHIRHQHQTPTDSPRSNIEIAPSKSFDSQRTIKKSASSNKLLQNSEQIAFINDENKPSKPRSNRRQQSSMTNEIKPSKSRENHRRRHQEQVPPLSNDSPSKRRIEPKQFGTPVMRIPLSQFNHQRQRQPIVLSSATTITKVHRIPT